MIPRLSLLTDTGNKQNILETAPVHPGKQENGSLLLLPARRRRRRRRSSFPSWKVAGRRGRRRLSSSFPCWKEGKAASLLLLSFLAGLAWKKDGALVVLPPIPVCGVPSVHQENFSPNHCFSMTKPSLR